MCLLARCCTLRRTIKWVLFFFFFHLLIRQHKTPLQRTHKQPQPRVRHRTVKQTRAVRRIDRIQQSSNSKPSITTVRRCCSVRRSAALRSALRSRSTEGRGLLAAERLGLALTEQCTDAPLRSRSAQLNRRRRPAPLSFRSRIELSAEEEEAALDTAPTPRPTPPSSTSTNSGRSSSRAGGREAQALRHTGHVTTPKLL
jgi:hypothetical protein